MSKHKILNYSKYITESSSWQSNHQHLFFSQAGFCPNCKKEAPIIFEDSDEYIVDGDSAACMYYGVDVHQCFCGWWDLIDHENTGSDSADPCLDYDTAYRGILQTFDSNDLQLPIAVLAQEIKKNPDIVDHIHHFKMEDLVKNALAQFFPGCIVEKFGSNRTHDGGFDGYIIIHEKKYGLQVKMHHGQNTQKGEPVSALRHLVGAMTIENVPNAVYVTNAHHFSYAFTRATQKALTRDIIDQIELIDRDRLFSMLELYTNNHSEVWQKLLPTWVKR